VAEAPNPITTTIPKPATAATVARWVVEVRRKHGRGYLAQVVDIVRLNRGHQRINPIEYYLYHLYDRSLHDAKARGRFIGHAGRRRIVRALNDGRAAILADDKLVTYGYLTGLGFPTPPLRALFHPLRTHGRLRCLRDEAEVAAYVRAEAAYPFFGKPLGRSNAVGVASIRGYRQADDALALAGDKTVRVEEFAGALRSFLPRGYLFLDHLWPHPAMREVCGERLCTVRVFALLGQAGPEILGAVWKVVVGANMADNFVLKGNLLAHVDTASGMITRVVGGSGPDEREHDTHPDTGARLVGFRLPQWDDLVELVRGAAGAFPRLPYQGWDIAITPTGPVIVELNSAGDLSLWQRPAGRGFMNDRFLALLKGGKG
jgi:hypothetical protein